MVHPDGNSSASVKKNTKRRRVERHEFQGKRQHVTSQDKTTCLPLQGMTVAVSAHQQQEKSSKSAETEEHGVVHSYNSIRQICLGLGATVSGQVHKRVECVVCAPSAITRGLATQRVRKAVKLAIPLVHVDWVLQCQVKNQRVEFLESQYVLEMPQQKRARSSTSLSKTHVKEKTRASAGNDNHCHPGDSSDEVEGEPVNWRDYGWSDPVALGCCCACHESNTSKDCEWCWDKPCSH